MDAAPPPHDIAGSQSPGAGLGTVLLRSSILGLFTGLFAVAYLWLVDRITDVVWPDEPGLSWFSGTIWTFLVPVCAGVLVGVIYQLFRLPPRYPGFIDELEAGEVDPRSAPGAIAIAVVSLAGGASLGPEAPLGTAGGAMGTWLARRQRGSAAEVRQMSFIGISGAFGGLLSTPIGGPLLAFELEHEQTHNYYFTNLVPGVVAGALSFGVMWPLVGAPFEGLLTIPQGEFRSWMLIAAAAMGVFGALAAFITGKVTVSVVNTMRKLDTSPITRGLVGGALVGATAFVLPPTLFSGQSELPQILDSVQELGVVFLLALALLKSVAMGASLGGGFYGGPIFPTFFIGATLGMAVNAVFPVIPLGISVGAMMAALGAAIALTPVSMSILAAIMVQSGLEAFGAIVVAAVAAYALRIAVSRRRASGDIQSSSAAHEPS
jgi:H+/Cl- antiporter ClcA